MVDTTDLLKIKIEQAKRELPLDTVNAIDAVDWRAAILGLRSKYGYTYEQLGDLETETELLLCGLSSAENYPKELEKRMRISKSSVNELVNEMNILVFKKIQEELIKSIERKKIFQKNATEQENNTKKEETPKIQSVEFLKQKLELGAASSPTTTYEIPKQEVRPIFMEKLLGTSKVGMVKTEHTIENMTKVGDVKKTTSGGVKVDPYREIPE